MHENDFHLDDRRLTWSEFIFHGFFSAFVPVFVPVFVWITILWPRLSLAQASAPPSTSFSSPRGAKPTRESGIWGVVRTDGAMVYSAPDFDGDILGNLNLGKRIVISRVTYGAQAKFYRVKVPVGNKAVFGYVADIDVRPDPKSASGKAENESSKPGKKVHHKKSESSHTSLARHKLKLHDEHNPIYFARFLGFVGGLASFQENIGGARSQQSVIVYGLKVTGQDVVIKGPIMDLSFLLHYGAPNYYDPLSAVKPTGFILWSDALLLMPFIQLQNATAYFGFGPLLVLSDFKVSSGGHALDLLSFNLGASLEVGGAVRLGSVALRTEVKYLWEKQRYFTYLAALQIPF